MAVLVVVLIVLVTILVILISIAVVLVVPLIQGTEVHKRALDPGKMVVGM